MQQNEQDLISGLFTKLKQAEQQAGPRDPGAEKLINDALSSQPAAPYYMSQVILVQEQAVAALSERVQKLEQELAERPASSGGGFLGGLFGGGSGQSTTTIRPDRTPVMPPGAQYGNQFGNQAAPGRGWGSGPAQPGGGGGFLASAMTTAVGVAGGMLLANAVGSMFGGPAEAAEKPAEEPPAEEPAAEQEDFMADDGGDFDSFGEF